MTKLTVLGCGGSLGVPNIMGRHGVCDMSNPKNFRTRTSAWVEHHGKNYLIDTSPDLRAQLFRENLTGIRPDAVLYTHTHADHCHGIDDLRSYFWPGETRVPVFGHPMHLQDLEQRFGYLFNGVADSELYATPLLQSHDIYSAKWDDVQIIEMPHGNTISLGYRFGPVAWCTDFKTIPPEGIAALRGIKVWCAAVADWESPHPSHAILSEVLALCEQLGNPRTYLIHLNPRFDYDKLDEITPSHVSPAHDGLVVELGK